MSNFNSLKDTFTLNNGYKIPCIGFGLGRLLMGKPQ